MTRGLSRYKISLEFSVKILLDVKSIQESYSDAVTRCDFTITWVFKQHFLLLVNILQRIWLENIAINQKSPKYYL